MLDICRPGPVTLRATLRLNNDERLRKLAFQEEKEFPGLVGPRFPPICPQFCEDLFAHLLQKGKDSPRPESPIRKLRDRDKTRLVGRMHESRRPGISSTLVSESRRRLMMYSFIELHLAISRFIMRARLALCSEIPCPTSLYSSSAPRKLSGV